MKLLNMEEFIKGLTPVTSTEYLLKTGEFNPEGLFSEEIFGSVGSAERGKTFSYINLFSEVVHPEAYRILKQLDRRIETLLSTESNYSVDNNGNLYVDEENGSSGIIAFKEMFPNISFRGGGQRDKLIETLRNSYKDGSLFIEYLPVIPPDFRPMYQGDDGEWIVDELNDTYISIMRKAFQISSAGSGPLYDLLNYELQNAVLNHDKYIRSKLGKKEGAIRGLTLGKRTDYTGRAVISPGPDLKPNQVGLPFRMAAKMFEPFIIHVLLKTNKIDQEELSSAVQNYLQSEVNVDSIQKILKSIRNGDKLPEDLYNIFWEATESAIYDRVVICKRDPVLHAKSLQGFYPKLIEGNTLQIPTVQVGGFNADFDGDQMAVYHPLTNESQEEVKNRMMSIKSGTSSDDISIEVSKEMAAGLYVLTKDYKPKGSPIQIRDEDIDNITDPTYAAKYKGKNTTAGKAIFNSCLPDNYPFVDGIIDKKRANKIISDLAENYSEDEAKEAVDCMKNYGFKFSTLISPTISIDQLELPPDLYEKKEKLGNASPEEAAEMLSEIQERLKEYLKNTGLGDLIESGSSKGWGQPMQILIAKGVVADAEGNLLQPIKSAFSEGLLPSDYFKASAGARKGIVDRTLKTADTGYMARKLVYLLQDVEADPDTYDCKTQRYLTLKLDKETIGRFHGRYHLTKDNKLEVFDKDNFDIGDIVQFRSPIFCRTKKICQTCYGKLLKRHQTPYVGTLAATALGERSTQLIMQSFHTGGSVSLAKRNLISDIIQNDPLIDLKENELKNYLNQVENSLVSKKPVKLTIDLNDYSLGDNLLIKNEEKQIYAASLVSKVEFDDKMFNLILDYPVNIWFTDYDKTEDAIEIEYGPDESILDVSMEQENIEEQVKYVERLLGGKEIYKDVTHLYNKLGGVYFPISDADSVHVEVLLSNVLRDKSDPSIPARLGKQFNPTMMNIKDIVFKNSYFSGLAFENINKATQQGLITEEEPEPSIIEKLMTGQLE